MGFSAPANTGEWTEWALATSSYWKINVLLDNIGKMGNQAGGSAGQMLQAVIHKDIRHQY